MFMRGKLSRATGEDVAVKRALAQFRREEKTARQEQRQNRRKARTAALLTWAGSVGRWVRPVAPLLFVTGFAMYGQIAYGVDAYSPKDWELPWRLAVAVGVAVAVESIALYVCWHAHDALLMGASATAARMRRGSYLIALAVAGVNYAHFAKDDWTPTPAAVVFALFSASGPWLWGLHTRRAQHIQLLREGQVDSSGAVFSAERWRAFPVRTWAARRWSIDTGETDPREAWRGYNAHRAKSKQSPAEEGPEEQVAAAVSPEVDATIPEMPEVAADGIVVSNWHNKTYVYRCIDASGTLLYVGATNDISARVRVHRKSRSWWGDVVEILTESYPDRAAALAVEQSAIANERPLYNLRAGSLRDVHGGHSAPAAVERKHLSADAEKVTPVLRQPAEGGASRVAVNNLLDERPEVCERVREIIREGGGRHTLMREFDLSEHGARQLLKHVRDLDAAESDVHEVSA